MKCPLCGSKKMYSYRTREGWDNIYRQRKCKACGCVISTKEVQIGLNEYFDKVSEIESIMYKRGKSNVSK